MEKLTWNEGIAAGRQAYAQIMSRGTKWRNRNIPIYIRDNLLVPFYITAEPDRLVLHVIRCPPFDYEKVTFEAVAHRPFDETTSLLIGPKSGG